MAVTVDNQVSAHTASGTSLTSGAFTISGTLRAAMVFMSFAPNSVTITSITVGGVAATIVSGADSTTENTAVRSVLAIAAGVPTGSQTANVQWTTTAECEMGVVTFNGADQTLNDGQAANNHGARFVGGSGETSDNLIVTSASGDRTCTGVYAAGGSPTTNQTIQWTSSPWAQDTGPGTATPTHTWSFTSSFQVVIVGASVIQDAGGGPPTVGGATAPTIFRVRRTVWGMGT